MQSAWQNFVTFNFVSCIQSVIHVQHRGGCFLQVLW